MIKFLSQGSVPKGEFGYFASEKKRRLLITVLLFVIPVGVFAVNWIRLGTRNTIWTVGAIVGSLPGCRSLVGLIMLLMRKSMDRGLYERILPHQGRLTMAYEMYMTFYDKSAYLDAFAVCGKTVVLFSTQADVDPGYIASHAQELIEKNGYRTDIKLLTSEKKFLERLDSMNENYDSLHAGLKDRKDERYPGLSRDEIVRRLLLDLCL